GYLRPVLHELLGALPAGTTVVVADVVDPASGQFPGALRIPVAWWRELAEGYDALLTVGSGRQPAMPVPRAGRPEAPFPLDRGPGAGSEPSPSRPGPSRPADLLY